VVQKCLDAVRTALANAHLWGADTLLLNPAVVDARTSYGDAWARSQAVIRSEILPVAEELQIVIGIENVWSGFLLSPLDYVRYIDELESPWVRAYLDVGNPIFGCPEHWVRIAGSRLVKLHVKDFRFDRAHGRFFFAKIGQGDIDWAALRAALLEIGFCGYMTNTGIPRSRFIRGMARGIRRLNGASAGAALGRTMAAVRHPADVRFLHDVSRRFDDFRDGRCTDP
jgi:hexulose-6-phosphate isomerase